ALRDIKVPLFVVGTEKDHVAPWRSVYKAALLTDSETFTFLLTSAGHNAGIVTPPGHPRRRYRTLTRQRDERFLSADEWLELAGKPQQGSWWPAWQKWLKSYSANKVTPPAMGDMLEAAPGTYVFYR